jgi:hypothetical protein
MRVRALVKGSAIGIVIGASLLLTGCSQSRETRAAEACIKAMAERIGDRPYTADISAIAAAAKAEGDDILAIESVATIDAAQANESKQQFTCRAQFDPAKPDAEPAVILFQFNF